MYIHTEWVPPPPACPRGRDHRKIPTEAFLSGLTASPGSQRPLSLAQRPASAVRAAPHILTPASLSVDPAQGWPSGSMTKAQG